MDYPFHLICNGLRFLLLYQKHLERKRKFSEKDYIVMKMFEQQPIIYCLVKVDKGYLPLNRDYKPIGFVGGWANYDEFPFLTILEGFIDLTIFDEDHVVGDKLFLYTDKTTPYREKNIKGYIHRVLTAFKKNEEFYGAADGWRKSEYSLYYHRGNSLLTLEQFIGKTQ